MKRSGRELLFLVSVAALAFSACWVSNHFSQAQAPHRVDPHQWLHDQLHITDEQERRLSEIEERFATRKLSLEATIKEANAKLGQAILQEKQYSKSVQTALDKIHVAQGELQKATLEHLFEMQTVLTPAQSSKLKRLAADALIHKP